MKRIWPFAALGLVALVAFAVVTLPARAVLSRLASYGVEAAGISGTVWRGSAQVLQVRGANLGRVSWSLHPLPLFMGRLSVDLKAVRPDGSIETSITVSPSRVRFADLNASLPLAALPANALPAGFVGTVMLRLEDLELTDGWPTAATGTVEVLDITGPANRLFLKNPSTLPVNIGRYKVSFPAGTPAAANAVVGALSDLGGPLQVNGTVQLKNDRTFLAEGLVATRPDAPKEIANVVQYLGSPDSAGRRPFSFENQM